MATKTERRDPRDYEAQCDACPLRGCPGPVFGHGPKDARIAIVGEGPGEREVEARLPFVGAAGRLLEMTLQSLGVNRSEIYIDNATLEMPRGGNLNNYLVEAKRELGKGNYVSPVDACRPRLFGFLGIKRCAECHRWEKGPLSLRCRCARPLLVPTSYGLTNVEVIVPLGNFALQALTGLDGIMKWRGSPLTLEDIHGFKKSRSGEDDEGGDEGDEEGEDAEGEARAEDAQGER